VRKAIEMIGEGSVAACDGGEEIVQGRIFLENVEHCLDRLWCRAAAAQHHRHIVGQSSTHQRLLIHPMVGRQEDHRATLNEKKPSGC